MPNEVGSLEPLRGYQGEDIEIQLPGSLSVYDIDWLAVWCVEYRHNFGHVFIPKDLDVPPALGQTKITVSVWVNLENQLVVSISKKAALSTLHTTYNIHITMLDTHFQPHTQSHTPVPSHMLIPTYLIIVYLFNLCAPH